MTPVPPICPMQNVAPANDVKSDRTGAPALFMSSWWLYFSQLGKRLGNRLAAPNYLDIEMFYPGTLVVGFFPNTMFTPCPPNINVGPFEFFVKVNTAPTGAAINFTLYRTSLFTIVGTGTIPAGATNGTFTPDPTQNFSEPGGQFFGIVTQVGSGVAGANMQIRMRWTGQQ